tara:strand:- start:4221 stop:4514 length:294 start_codon:yes stop_codon:yes gene_type:complete
MRRYDRKNFDSGIEYMLRYKHPYKWIRTETSNLYKLETLASTQNCKIRRDIDSNDIEEIELPSGPTFTTKMTIDNKRIEKFFLELGEIFAECSRTTY